MPTSTRLLILLIVCTPCLRALDPNRQLSSFSVDHWNRKNGLPGQVIRCLAQTPDRYLWVGTDNGLYRFDGYQFRHMAGDQLSTARIWDLAVDDQGRLWVAEHSRLLLREEGVFREVTRQNAIRTMVIAKDGACWLGTWFGLIRITLDGEIRKYGKEEGLDVRIRDLTVTSQGIVCATSTQVFLIENESVIPMGGRNNRCLTPDGTGGLWSVDYQRGIVHRSALRSPPVVSEIDSALPDADLIYGDSHHSLWITWREGLARYWQGELKVFELTEGQPDGISSMFEDGDGNLWLGTWLGSLYRLRQGIFTHLFATSGSAKYGRFFDREGNSWMVDDSHLYRHGRQKSRWPVPSSGSGRFPTCIGQAPDESIWVGTEDDGVLHLRNGALQRWPPYASGEALDLAWDHDGGFWINTRIDLLRFVGDRLTHRYTPEKDGVVFGRIQVDHEGTIWAASSEGLIRYQEGKWHVVETLRDIWVSAIHSDGDDRLWLVSVGGIGLLQDDRLRYFAATAGKVNWGFDLGLDKAGFLWVFSDRGILRLNPDDMEETALHFGYEHGLKSKQATSFRPAVARDPDGRMWFATNAGPAYIQPEQVIPPGLAPPLQIDHLSVDGSALAADEPEIRLEPGRHRLEVDYSAIDLSQPELLRFRYRLYPHDTDWRSLDNRRELVLNGLPPGRSQLQLAVAYEGGDWNALDPPLAIRQKQWFYQSRWFPLLMVIAGVLMATLAYAARLRRLRYYNLQLSRQVRERTVGLQAEKEKTQQLYAQLHKDNTRKTRELEEARSLQLAMLPAQPPSIPGVTIAVHMATATEVGGDYYDFHQGPGDAFTVVIGDATGHGMKAGMLVATTKSHFLFHAEDEDCAAILGQISTGIRDLRFKNMFVALSLLRLDGYKASFVSGGMPPLYIRRVCGEVEEVRIPGLPLGSPVDFPYRVRELDLARGDVILLMTDGLSERFNREEAMLGEAAVSACLAEVGDRSPQDIVAALVALGEEWSSGRPQDDDIALVVIKYDPN